MVSVIKFSAAGMKGFFKAVAILFICVASVCASAQNLPPEQVKSMGGRYIWVPDSLRGQVLNIVGRSDLLDGGEESEIYRSVPSTSSKIPELESKTFYRPSEQVDVNEKVIYKGDTIPMVLRQRNLGRFDRGMLNYLFIPRGQWQFGLTVSYGEFSTSNLEMFDLVSDVDLSAHSFAIRPYLSYFIKNNMSLGVRFAYSSTSAGMDSFRVDIDEDMNFNLHDISYKDESYTAAMVFNQYFGIARRGRFAVFNEVELAFASGTSDFRRPFNDEIKHTHTTYTRLGLNFSPGVAVKVMPNVSFNLSFGVFGFYLKNEKQRVDGEYHGNRLTSGANFRFNIFNINFGLGVHI